MVPASREFLASSAPQTGLLNPSLVRHHAWLLQGWGLRSVFFFCRCCLQTGMGLSPLIKGWTGTAWCPPVQQQLSWHILYNVKFNILLVKRRWKSLQDRSFFWRWSRFIKTACLWGARRLTETLLVGFLFLCVLKSQQQTIEINTLTISFTTL